MFDDLIFPNVITQNWQMMPWERIALTGLLSRMKPKGALEVGVYYGGSLSLTSQYASKIIGIDIDEAVLSRFERPSNVDLWIGSSTDLIPRALEWFSKANIPLNFVLIDADHSAAGVKRDIELVLQYRPTEPMLIAMHDSGNPDTRQGILAADWTRNPHVHMVECDFVPGQIIEHSVTAERGEIWGGLALAYLDPILRPGPLTIQEGARTSIRCLHHCAPDLSILR
ncbi:class I SAM-dependent methyltransferase [Plastoroseomonas hellenica]|uniref:class I SAM-dependent methyltransferase n=1 Tax=Plastoroseomonas hellenica TaxID=2687306 RepID=UPI001BA679E0|nr:class I SAM-dependent methyltransferase [Plastoroseomonas hellenica]MBR0644700.1 class I SAM-dependent methyltransferase [Plastoroseomonas hellenica]